MVTLYIEGGGDSPQLKSRCRKAFNKFIHKMGFVGKMPKLVACGSRRNAYEHFSTAVKQGHPALLLIDSEAPVDPAHEFNPWPHLQEREGDGWNMPPEAEDDSCHLMVECMENWFLADIPTLEGFFGSGFKSSKLPATSAGIEKVSKKAVYAGLKQATQTTSKKGYSKGDHSFSILEQLDPSKVIAASPWAAHFKHRLQVEMDR